MESYRKYFVPATSNDRGAREVTSSSRRGEEIRKFYDELISSETKTLIGKVKLKRSAATPTKELSRRHRLEERKTVNAFLKAAQDDDADKLETYLNNSAWDVNVRDSYGWTALMCAAKNGSLGAFKLLLEHDADPCITDHSGNSARRYATIEKHFEILKLLAGHMKKKSSSAVIDEVTSSKPKVPFYCDYCKMQFTESEHRTSTVHQLRDAPKSTSTSNLEIPEHNVGFQLMLHQGWDKEKGLGPDGDGIRCPLKTILKRDRKGLGDKTATTKARVTHFKPHDRNAVKNVNLKRSVFRCEKLKPKHNWQRNERKEKRKEIQFRRMFYED